MKMIHKNSPRKNIPAKRRITKKVLLASVVGMAMGMSSLVLVTSAFAVTLAEMKSGKLMYAGKFEWARENRVTRYAARDRYNVEVRQSPQGAVALVTGPRGIEALCAQKNENGIASVGEYKELEFECGSASWGVLSTLVVVKMERVRGEIQVGTWLSGYQSAPLKTVAWNPGIAPRPSHLMVFSR